MGAGRAADAVSGTGRSRGRSVITGRWLRASSTDCALESPGATCRRRSALGRRCGSGTSGSRSTVPGTGSTPASWPRKAAGVRVNHAGSQYSTNTRFNTFAPDAAYDLRVGNSRRTIIRTAGLTLSLASGVMLALWCLVELTPWGWFVPMAISAVGNGLSQLPGCSGRRLPHDSALAMVAVVVASLALALVVGLLALRRPGAAPRAARSARLRA